LFKDVSPLPALDGVFFGDMKVRRINNGVFTMKEFGSVGCILEYG